LSFEEVLIDEVKACAKDIGACAVAIACMVGDSTRTIVEMTVGAAVSACQSNGMTYFGTIIKE
jgi:hypothetical protein